MERFYDNKNNRLVYIGEASTANYWNKHWDKNTIEKQYPKNKSPFDYVVNTTTKYLSKGGIILEGGCGVGQQVFKLQNTGYKAIGVDYAKRTVEIVKKAKPEIDIRHGDVRKLDFPNNYFDGYWSFGVIEHFYNGYDEILNEMQRTIKHNGYLFITFPHMSMFRRFKAKKNKYPHWKEKRIEKFYQFALDEERVILDFEKINFKLVKKEYLDGIKGLKDELTIMKKVLQKTYDSRTFIGLVVSKIISILFKRFSSHSILLVLQKQ